MVGRLPVQAESVWVRKDFPNEDAWTEYLDSAAIGALVEYGSGGSFVQLRAQMDELVGRWRTALEGRGFLRLRGFPTGSRPDAEVERAYIGLGQLLGSPVGQDRRNSLVTHIIDKRVGSRDGRRFETNLGQDFHSDASDLVGLLCLCTAKSGGRSTIISGHAIYNEMLRRSPDLVDVMYGPMPWSRHGQPGAGEQPFFLVSPFADIDGVPRVSLITWYIRRSQTHAGAPRLTPDQIAALDLVEAIMSDEAFQISMTFEVGDVQFLNNATVLHAREPYVDHDDPAKRRHLLRVWLKADAHSPRSLLPR